MIPPKASLVASVAALALFALSSSNTMAQSTRDWRTWPFSQNSPWNMPIGSNAQFAAADLSKLTGYVIYTGPWAVAVAQGRSTDRMVKVLTNSAYPATNWMYINGGGVQCGAQSAAGTPVNNSGPYGKNIWSTAPVAPYHNASQDWQPTVYFPTGVCPSPDTDGYMVVVQPNGWSLDTYATVVLTTGDIEGDQVTSFVNLKGDGTGFWNGRRASLIPSSAGLIRTGEIAAGKIPHALSVQISPAVLTTQAVWPAWAYDTNDGYSGTLPMGSLLAIPGSVDINTLGLSAKGLVVARAAQDYGVYLVDRGGGGIQYQSETNNPDVNNWSQASNDLAIITKKLQRVTNNSSSTPGGGGTPRAPLAPPFYDDVAQTPAPGVTFSAAPSSITSGQTSKLTWSSTNSTSCSGTNFSTGGAVSGTLNVTPTATTSYSIACTGGGGTTNASASVTVTAASDAQAPTAPTGLAGSAVSSSQVNLTWNASSDNVGVTGYNVFRNGTKIGTAQSTSYSNTGLTAGTTYSYAVSAYDAAGNTSAQATASVTTPASASGGATLADGSRVATTSSTQVRAKPTTGGPGKIRCTQASGSLGTITDGPRDNNGYTWWSVNFDSSCDGWVTQTSLTTTP